MTINEFQLPCIYRATIARWSKFNPQRTTRPKELAKANQKSEIARIKTRKAFNVSSCASRVKTT